MSLSKDEILSPFLITEDSIDTNKEESSIDILKRLKDIIISIESTITSDINSNIYIKIKEYFPELNNLIESLKNEINANNNQKESLMRKNENDLRALYSKYFGQKLINEVQENKLSALHKKEKEYELLKQKTGAIVCNGQVICNERKENEIIILRTENSLLKTAIKNNEDLLKEKNEIINSLNNDIILYKAQIDELRREKYRKYSSFSNINININEAKKDINKKKVSNNKVYLNNVGSSNKEKNIPNNKKNNNNNINNKKGLTNKNNLNNLNNIYSSYQINSQLINKINKNSTQNKDEIYQTNNISKNTKNETIGSNKTYLIKYISVNKSLFSPKNQIHKIEFNNNDKKTLQINRIRKNKFILNNNLNKEYKTMTIEPHIDDKKVVKVKKINNRLNIKHKKSYSIQFPENSIKNLMQKNKDKIISIGNENINNNNFYFTMRKIDNIKSNTSKNKNSFSSIIKTFTDGFKTNENKNNQKYLNYFMKSYDERRNNIGRNINYSHIANESRDNSLTFLQKTFVNRTNYEKMF